MTLASGPETPPSEYPNGAPQQPVLIDFYYDVISPYAKLAFAQLPQTLMGIGHVLRYKPVLFAALLKHHGQLGPAEIAAKRDWTYRQVAWLAHQHGLSLQLPASHPFNPLALLRLGLACAHPATPGQTNRWVTEQLLNHVWQGGQLADCPQRLAALQARLMAPERQAQWQDPDGPGVRQALRENTDEALRLGLFGVPICVVAGRLFWGFDGLAMLRAYLLGDPWFNENWAAAAARPVGTERPR